MCTPDSRLRSYCVDGARAGLVVGDDQLAVGVELEPVDDAAEADAVDLGLEPQLEADGLDRGGVFEPEVVAHEVGRLGEEGGRRLVVEVEPDELGVVAQVVGRVVEAGERRPSGVRSAGGRQWSRSSAAWTSVPLVAATVGGSGRRSMAENRNASAQSVNDETLDGLSVRGTGKAMGRAYARGVTVSGDAAAGQPRSVRPARRRHRRRVLHRAEVGEVGVALETAVRAGRRRSAGPLGRAHGVAARGHGDGAGHLAEAGERVVAPARRRTPRPRSRGRTSARRRRRRAGSRRPWST